MYQLLTGFFLQLYMYRDSFYHVYIMMTVTYIIMAFLPRRDQAKVNMVFVLGYLSSQHIHSMMTDFGGYSIEITTYTMILVAKLWGLGYAYRDGGDKEEDLTPSQ